jgi:hypothetical protein
MLAALPQTLLAQILLVPIGGAEPAQLKGHLRSGVGGAEQTGDKGALAPAGEAGTAWTSCALPADGLATRAR